MTFQEAKVEMAEFRKGRQLQMVFEYEKEPVMFEYYDLLKKVPGKISNSINRAVIKEVRKAPSYLKTDIYFVKLLDDTFL